MAAAAAATAALAMDKALEQDAFSSILVERGNGGDHVGAARGLEGERPLESAPLACLIDHDDVRDHEITVSYILLLGSLLVLKCHFSMSFLRRHSLLSGAQAVHSSAARSQLG